MTTFSFDTLFGVGVVEGVCLASGLDFFEARLVALGGIRLDCSTSVIVEHLLLGQAEFILALGSCGGRRESSTKLSLFSTGGIPAFGLEGAILKASGATGHDRCRCIGTLTATTLTSFRWSPSPLLLLLLLQSTGFDVGCFGGGRGGTQLEVNSSSLYPVPLMVILETRNENHDRAYN